ncbi:MAG: glycosyltransferase [Bacillota bacterium]|nr:glycosyltransferase [Bacillota bacterium]
MNTAPSVSLCVIARDEEDVLASCLASARHLVQEIIVVDTGSTDRTKEVAAQAGAKVLDFPWTGDFAAARNRSLDEAQGEWILVLDADELLRPVTREDFARLLVVPGIEGWFLTVKSFLGKGEEEAEDEVVRLFRNRPEYRFSGAIHEQVAGAIVQVNGGGGLARAPELVIEHFGYLDRRRQAKKKHERNVSLLTHALEKQPDDPFLHYGLGAEFFQGNEVKQGIDHLERALAGLRGNESYCREVFVLLILAYLRDGQLRQASRTAAKAARQFPCDPDLQLLQGLLAYERRQAVAAVRNLRQAASGGARLLARHHLHTLLGDACVLVGRFEEAEREYLEALRLAPHLLYPLTQLIGVKKRGRGKMPWLELCGFASPAQLLGLKQQLPAPEDDPVALILALLAVLGAAAGGDASDLTRASRSFLEATNRPGPAEAAPWENALREYLRAAAGELLACAAQAAARLECGFSRPREKARAVASTCLNTVVQGLCPPWAPLTSGRL